MINQIINGISNKLYKTFGDQYTIYSEPVPQHFREPCFFIRLLNPSQEQMLGQRYYGKHPFDILYFPKRSREQNREIHERISELYDALEYITIGGDVIRGTDMYCETVDSVLHFFVSYNTYLTKEKEIANNMENLHVKNTKKEEEP